MRISNKFNILSQFKTKLNVFIRHAPASNNVPVSEFVGIRTTWKSGSALSLVVQYTMTGFSSVTIYKVAKSMTLSVLKSVQILHFV